MFLVRFMVSVNILGDNFYAGDTGLYRYNYVIYYIKILKCVTPIR